MRRQTASCLDGFAPLLKEILGFPDRFTDKQNRDSRLPGPNSLHEEFNWRPVAPAES